MDTTPPEGLGGPGSRTWEATVSAFELNPVELAGLGELARLEDLLVDLHAKLLTEDLVTMGSRHNPRANPLIAQITALARVMPGLITALALPLLPEQESQRNSSPDPLKPFRGQARGHAA